MFNTGTATLAFGRRCNKMMIVPEHTCDVVEIKLEKHPNADSLSLVMVDGTINPSTGGFTDW